LLAIIYPRNTDMESRIYIVLAIITILIFNLSFSLSVLAEEGSISPREIINLPDGVKNLLSGGVYMREFIGAFKLKREISDYSKDLMSGFSPLQSTLPILQSPRNATLEQSIFGPNIRVTRDSPHYFPFENEPSVVVNPVNASNIVVAAHDYSDPNYIVGIAVYRSLDGGRTWLGPVRMIPTYGDTLSDPSLAAGRDGTIYLSYLSVGAFSEITLAISRDGGATWSFVRALNYSVSAFYDKPWIVVGPDPSNPLRDNIYITYTEFKGFYEVNLSIKIIVSKDGGRTFEGPYSVSWEGRYPDILVQWSYPVVDPRGILYVSFFGAKVERGLYEGRVIQGIWVARSVDGGRTFSEPVLAAETHWWFPYYAGPFGFRWIVPTPATAVGPDDTIYIAYEDDPDGPEGPDMGDIFLVFSRDGGRTWSNPKRINDDTGYATQFFPMISVRRSDGSIHIAWGDKRLDPGGIGYDIYYTYSKDGGSTFAKNIRVTDITVNPMYGLPFFIGDYFGMAVSDNNVYIVWTDSRRGSLAFVPGAYRNAALNQDIYIAFLGQRDQPSISIYPEDIETGYTDMVAIDGKGFPREARLGIAIGPMIVSKEVWSDSNGYIRVYLNVESLPPGNISIQIFDPTNGYVIASRDIAITPNRILTAISNQIAGGFTNISSMLSSIGARLVSVENGVAVINTSLGMLRLDLRSINSSIARLEGDVATITTNLGVLRVRLEDLGARVVNISGDLAVVRTSIGDIVGRISAIQGNVATVVTDLGVIRARLDENIVRSSNIEARVSMLESIYIPLLLSLQFVTIALLALLILRRRGSPRPAS
jgi:hypothetical protein